MNATPDRLVNANGFTDDDAVARELTLEGRPHLYDDIVMDVRKAYREGLSAYRAIYSGYANSEMAAILEQSLQEVFTTSDVNCSPNPRSQRELAIVVRFPGDQPRQPH